MNANRRNFITALAGLVALPSWLTAAHAHRGAGGPPAAPTSTTFPLEDLSDSDLERWLRIPIQPVWDMPYPMVLDLPIPPFFTLIEAIRSGEPVTFRYQGGSTPGHNRTVHPALVFRKIHPNTPAHSTDTPLPDNLDMYPDLFRTLYPDGPLYLLAWCHERNALRTFRLDLIDFHEPGFFLP